MYLKNIEQSNRYREYHKMGHNWNTLESTLYMYIMSEHIIKFICLNVSLKINSTYFSLKLNCHCYYWSLRAVMQYGITFLEKCTFSTTGFRNNLKQRDKELTDFSIISLLYYIVLPFLILLWLYQDPVFFVPVCKI